MRENNATKSRLNKDVYLWISSQIRRILHSGLIHLEWWYIYIRCLGYWLCPPCAGRIFLRPPSLFLPSSHASDSNLATHAHPVGDPDTNFWIMDLAIKISDQRNQRGKNLHEKCHFVHAWTFVHVQIHSIFQCKFEKLLPWIASAVIHSLLLVVATIHPVTVYSCLALSWVFLTAAQVLVWVSAFKIYR